MLIKSAQFYADNPTTVTFELRSSNGAVLDDTTHSLSQGQQQLILNFEVPIGNNMQLGISNGNSDLYRNDAGAIYPYNIGSVMSITGTSAGSPGYYYFYYDIEVEVPCDNTVSSIDDLKEISKELVKILDVLGREVVPNPNQTQFYIYDDGSVQKQINIE